MCVVQAAPFFADGILPEDPVAGRDAVRRHPKIEARVFQLETNRGDHTLPPSPRCAGDERTFGRSLEAA